MNMLVTSQYQRRLSSINNVAPGGSVFLLELSQNRCYANFRGFFVWYQNTKFRFQRFFYHQTGTVMLYRLWIERNLHVTTEITL
jgi:hypothetical protein